LIIGGGISGTTAAEVLREKEAHDRIAILDAEAHPLYSKVKIPSYLKGKSTRDTLFLRKLGDYENKKINLYSNTKISKIDPDKHEVYTHEGEIFSYKKLLISSGGYPKPWPAEGESSYKLLRMHTVEDADYIKKSMVEAENKEALVIGEGFIALEFAETFILNGFRAHLLERGEVWGGVDGRFGKSGGEMLEENFKRHGVTIHKNVNPEAIGALGIKASLAGVGIGIKRNFDMLAGIKVGRGIITNEFLATTDPDIYAAGDVAEFFDVIAGHRRVVGNWTNSFLQGRTAALNMLASVNGNALVPFRAVSAYNITNLGLGLAFVGCLEDADDHLEYVSDTSLARLFFKENKLHGAVLINRFNDKIKLAQLIDAGAAKHELEKTFS